MEKILKICTLRERDKREAGVIPIRQRRIRLCMGSSKKARTIPMKIGRKMCTKVLRKPYTVSAWNSRKKNAMAPTITQNAVTPSAK